MENDKELAQSYDRLFFSNFDPFIVLDRILEILTKKDNTGGVTIETSLPINVIYYELQHKFNITLISTEELNSIIDKLIDDKFIKDRVLDQGTTQAHCLTFDGLVFFREGGYTKRELDKQNERKRLINLEDRTEELLRRQIDLQVKMIILTAIVAVGTSIAAVYYFFQVYDGVSKSHKCEILLITLGSLLSIPILAMFQKRKQQK